MAEVDIKKFCEICKGNIDWNRELILDNLSKCLKCDTIYHKNHLEDWLGSKSFCPNCRLDISRAEIYNFAPSTPIAVTDNYSLSSMSVKNIIPVSQRSPNSTLYGVWLSVNALWQFLLFFILLFNDFSYYGILLTQTLLLLINIKIFMIFLLPLLVVNVIDLNRILDLQNGKNSLLSIRVNLVLNLLVIGLYMEISAFYSFTG